MGGPGREKESLGLGEPVGEARERLELSRKEEVCVEEGMGGRKGEKAESRAFE